MAMNFGHRLYCNSNYWARTVKRELLPWALDDIELGDKVLEIGPGYGANLRVLVDKTPSLTSVEIDGPMAARLQNRYGDRARVINGDGTATGLPEAGFSSVVCFTMLHHVPTPPLQDQLFAEAFRVLAPGGVFAGSDGLHSVPFRIVHLGDTYNPISPDTLPDRLRQAGFSDIQVDTKGRDQRWRALKSG
ncbi:MAG: class I SAM-dependent methyltransferase [Mycolicibacterium sp.]|uniref:class I SAM-dependent methyltransferase n=1 Tax=Mycolicibacterium sp. TaxID=2320850 RepID=UPI003D1274C3